MATGFSKRNIAALAGLVLLLGAVASTAPVQAKENKRPLSDWLSAQGTTDVFFPPVPDLVGQGNCDDPPLQPLRFALSDYTGSFNAWIKSVNGPDLGTTVSGTVTEVPLADGRARVHVVTHARNALTTVWDDSVSFPGPIIFGRSAAEVAAGMTGYALGDNDMELTFINNAPGAPLPNLVFLFGNLNDPPLPPGVEVTMWRYSARAMGELRAAFGVPDGTGGRFMTSQTGMFGVPPHGECFGFPEVFPVETMFLHQLGQ